MDAAGADRRLVDMGHVSENWIDGIARIDALGGGTYRFVLYQEHKCADGTIENEVVASLLTNIAALQGAAMTLRALLACAVEGVRVLM